MNSVSGVCPSRNFAASLSKSSNSRSRIGMMWPGTSSTTSGLVSDPARPVGRGSVEAGSIPRNIQIPVGIRDFRLRRRARNDAGPPIGGPAPPARCVCA